jgi:hypothetical protein
MCSVFFIHPIMPYAYGCWPCHDPRPAAIRSWFLFLPVGGNDPSDSDEAAAGRPADPFGIATIVIAIAVAAKERIHANG